MKQAIFPTTAQATVPFRESGRISHTLPHNPTPVCRVQSSGGQCYEYLFDFGDGQCTANYEGNIAPFVYICGSAARVRVVRRINLLLEQLPRAGSAHTEGLFLCKMWYRI